MQAHESACFIFQISSFLLLNKSGFSLLSVRKSYGIRMDASSKIGVSNNVSQRALEELCKEYGVTRES